MPTTQEENRAKSRQRNRKADRRKGEQKAEMRLDAEAIDLVAAPTESVPIAEILEEVILEEVAPEKIAQEEMAQVETAVAEAADKTMRGEVLPPEVRQHAAQAAGLPAIVQVYTEYARKSWAANRFLVERLIAARSIDEAVEIQGEFAQQACANFAAQSQKIFEFYGDWAQQMFKPFEKFTAEWTQSGGDRVSHTLH